MIKRIMTTLLISAILLTICGCSQDKKSDLAFYVIKRNNITASLSDREVVKVAKKSGRLAFDGEDIEGYNWQTHTVKLYESAVPSLGSVSAESGGSKIFKADDTYAFVLIIKNELIYLGGFKAGSKNPDIPLQPSIRDGEEYTFSIVFDAKYSTGPDNRSNNKLYDFLNKFGMLSSIY